MFGRKRHFWKVFTHQALMLLWFFQLVKGTENNIFERF